MNHLENLASFTVNAHWEDFPDEVKQAAITCTLDTIAPALGASNNSLFLEVVESFLKFGNEEESEKGTAVWGTDKKTNLRTAVLLNSMLSHILELDDVHTGSKVHIGTVVIPVAWGLCEYLGKSGRDFLEAVICAYEVAARIGMGFGVSSHRNKGWHVTSTAGIFGAAAACGKLLGFSAEQMVYAFGLAGTQACATWVFLTDGATHKILHPGRASANGLDACLLVLGGMKGSRQILDADDGGLFPMMSDEYDYSLVDKNLGTTWEILLVDKKPYPCCRSTHCAIDAALELKEKYHILPEEIKEIHIDTYLAGWKQCAASNGSLNPTTPTEAKFSTPYVTACAFLNGSVDLNDFEPEQILRQDRKAFLQKVTVSPHSVYTDRYPDHWGCEMTVTLTNGQSLEMEIIDASGSISSPLTTEQIFRKANICCSRFDSAITNTLFKQLLALDCQKTLPSLNI